MNSKFPVLVEEDAVGWVPDVELGTENRSLVHKVCLASFWAVELPGLLEVKTRVEVFLRQKENWLSLKKYNFSTVICRYGI